MYGNGYSFYQTEIAYLPQSQGFYPMVQQTSLVRPVALRPQFTQEGMCCSVQLVQSNESKLLDRISLLKALRLQEEREKLRKEALEEQRRHINIQMLRYRLFQMSCAPQPHLDRSLSQVYAIREDQQLKSTLGVKVLTPSEIDNVIRASQLVVITQKKESSNSQSSTTNSVSSRRISFTNDVDLDCIDHASKSSCSSSSG